MRPPNAIAYLAATLAQEVKAGSPNQSTSRIALDAEAIITLGKEAAKIALLRCNGVNRFDATMGRSRAMWTADDEREADADVARIVKDTNVILAGYGGGEADANGDPRGLVLTFRLASGRSNCMDVGRWGV